MPAPAEGRPAACPVCGGRESRFAFRKDGYDHLRCRSCGLIYVHPMPSPAELTSFYASKGKQPTSALCYESAQGHLKSLWDRLLGGIERQCGQGKLLDVGCGSGQFLAHASRRGWSDLIGLELSPQAAQRARETSGAAVLEKDFLSSDLPAQSFLAVTLWDVLEHLPEPRRVLRRARELLLPGGFLALSTVSWSGLTLRLLGARALVVMPPEHLAYYGRKSIRCLLSQEQLRPVQLGSRDLYLREWTRLLGRNRGTPEASEKQYRRCRGLFNGSRLFPLFIAGANIVLNASDLGDELIAVARTPN